MEDSVYEQYHAHYVAQGIAVLDEHVPDWRSKIVGWFDVASPFACIVGQVYRAQWQPLHEAYEDAMTDWRRAGMVSERPPYVHVDPYRYGIRALMAASGVDMEAGIDVDQWASDHGFLAEGDRVDVTAWSTDDDVTALPLLKSMLNHAWRNALAAA